MLPIAGQTPGPLGLKFMGGWGEKIQFYFHGQRRALRLVNPNIDKIHLIYEQES